MMLISGDCGMSVTQSNRLTSLYSSWHFPFYRLAPFSLAVALGMGLVCQLAFAENVGRFGWGRSSEWESSAKVIEARSALAMVKPTQSNKTQSSPSKTAKPNIAVPSKPPLALKAGQASASKETSKKLVKPADPEAQPLSLYEKQYARSEQRTGDTIARLISSLIAVLILFLGFVRWLLPGLMAKYPEFFERMRQQGQSAASSPRKNPGLAGSRDGQGVVSPGGNDVMADSDETGDEPLDEETDAVASPGRLYRHRPLRLKERRPDLARQEALSPSSALGMVLGHGFGLLGSLGLGDGRDLHLIDMPGHRLLIATTPDSINLLQAFTAEAGTRPDLQSLQLPGFSPTSPDNLSYGRFPHREPVLDPSLEPRALTTSAPEYNPHAEKPQRASMAAGQPVLSGTVSGKAAKVPTPAEWEARVAAAPPRHPSRPRPTLKPIADDAEVEIVVLKDYDDVF